MTARWHNIWPWAASGALATGAFMLSCSLTSTLPGGNINWQTAPDGSARWPASQSIGARVLGGVLTEIGRSFYLKADRYFHRGVAPYKKHDFDDPFQRFRREIEPAHHMHVHGMTITEIMPWLRSALWADPTYVEPYLVTAYWLAGEAGRPDVAENVLQEGWSNNPLSYEIRLELGRLYLKTERLVEAEAMFTQALNLWPSELDPNSEDARIDKVQILLYRALLYEVQDNTAAALSDLRAALAAHPAHTQLAKRIQDLEQGHPPRVPPKALWQSMLLHRRHVCSHEHDHEHEHDHVHEKAHVR